MQLPNHRDTRIPVAFPGIKGIEIVKVLGRGGMSTVYQARQLILDRFVALKVLSNYAVSGEGGIERFHKEAQCTSALNHPNIVKTLAFGVSSAGQPYLLMEYLEGVSLAEELRVNGRLTLQKFKEVFLSALSALEHAHNAGVVHRDIKPANIMLCSSPKADGLLVKLLDFGIAKCLSDGIANEQALTKTTAFLGSPAYISPEQCQGKAVDARSDLYSLGCVMYEALMGKSLFDAKSSLELMQKHCVEPPPTVSQLNCVIDVNTELLELILSAVAKPPNARPQTAAEFGDKLERVLESLTLDKLPILKTRTRRPSKNDSLMEWTAAFALLWLLLLFIFAAYLQSSGYLRPPIAQRTVGAYKQEKQSLLDEQNKQCSFQQMLDQQLKSARPRGLQHSDSPEELIEQARIFLIHGKSNEAESLLKQALELLVNQNHKNPLTRATLLLSLGSCYLQNGRAQEAEPLLAKALADKEKVLGADSLDVAEILLQLGICSIQQGKWKRSEEFIKRSRAIAESTLGQNSPLAALSSSILAEAYYRQGLYSKAELLFQRSLTIMEKELGSESPNLADPLHRLGSCYKNRGMFPEAEKLLRRSLAIKEKMFGPTAKQLRASVLDLVEVCLIQHKFIKAESWLKRMNKIETNLSDSEKVDLFESKALVLQAACLSKRNKHCEAAVLQERSLAILNIPPSSRTKKLSSAELSDLSQTFERMATWYEQLRLLSDAERLRKIAKLVRSRLEKVLPTSSAL